MAVRFLRSKGHVLLHRNWRSGRSEIDIITTDCGVLVFIEVKTRRESDKIGGYAPAVSVNKRNALRVAIDAFMQENDSRYPHFRFDVVEVLTCGKLFSAEKIFHYEGVHLGRD